MSRSALRGQSRIVALIIAFAVFLGAGGSVAGWYTEYAWYDEFTHCVNGFALTLLTGAGRSRANCSARCAPSGVV